MAEEKKPYSDKVLKQQKKINDEGQLLVNILKSQLAAQKKISQELGKQNKDRDEAKADEAFILKASREGIKLAKKLADFSRTDLQNKAKRKSFDIAQQNALNEIKILEAKAAEAAEAGLHKREELLLNQVDSTKQAVEASKELTKEYKSLDFAKGFLGGMENLVKDIPVINKLFGGLTKSVNAAGDEYEKSGNERQARLKGYMTFGKELAKLSLGALLAALVAGFVALDKSTVQLTRNLGLGSRSAKKLVGELQGVENQKADLGDLTESAQGLAEALGSAVPPTAKAVFQATILSKRLGISAEASARLYKLSVQNGNSFEATTDTIIGQTKALNATSKVSINYRQILDDISKVSSATLLNTNRFPGGINKAAFAARKLGLSFETLDSSASSMLNFETSIASELEAELLMGKQLNLQKAREAALMGDQATLAQEISKQVGSASQFAKMNEIQQQAVAEAVGMSREDLAESLVQREALLKLERDSGIAGIAKMETEEKIAALIA